MLSLDDPRWEILRFAHGSAKKIPPILRKIQSAASRGVPFDFDSVSDLWEICHQWSTYDATYATLPHLTAICSSLDPNNDLRISLLDLYGWAMVCLRLNSTSAPNDIVSFFEMSVPVTRELIRQSLGDVTPGRSLRTLLGALAGCSGDSELGLAIYQLYDGTVHCDGCGALIQPMRTGFNPLRRSK